MSFDIKFDYRFDSNNFFTDERKAILEQAGDIWSSYIQDEFEDIPAGELLTFNIDGEEQQVTLDEPIDDLIIFVSSVELDSNALTLGEGAFYANYAEGSIEEQRILGDDFQPWLGTIEFNSASADNFYFDSTPETDDDIPFDKQDFLSLSLHEIGHVLGIGISDAFKAQIEDGEFTGTNSVGLNNGQPIPLDEDDTHIAEGFSLDADADSLLDKTFTFGERNLPTALDLGALADIGYDIIAYDDAPVFHFYQLEKGFHFYTADLNERNVTVEKSDRGELDYELEDVAFRTLMSDKDSLTGETIEGVSPVYRFFDMESGEHVFTIDEAEKDALNEDLGSYVFEGISYYAFESQPEDIDTVPLYQMFNSDTESYVYSTNSEDLDGIRSSEGLSPFDVEADDAIAYYVIESL